MNFLQKAVAAALLLKAYGLPLVVIATIGFYVANIEAFGWKWQDHKDETLSILLGREQSADQKPTFELVGDPADPASYLEDRQYSLVSHGPILSREGGLPVFISDVFVGYRAPGADEHPMRAEGYLEQPACEFSEPDPTYHVANIHIDEANAATTIFADQKGLVANWMNPRGRETAVEPFDYRDIVVTHTDRPVHLVLATRVNYALWNLHLADGAEIARITTLNGVHAFANLPDGVPVERGFEHGSGGCRFQIEYPWYSDPFRHMENDPNNILNQITTADDMREDYQKRVWDYRNWFTTHFGVGAFERRAGWYNAPAVLIGPTPIAPLDYTPLSASILSVPETATIYGGPSTSSELLFKGEADS
ncbi:MAG: hypothetical protein QNI90_13425 [Dinoroseobacter sp.]|nr:hypothetical protein [Dinoroseobacter sp.]